MKYTGLADEKRRKIVDIANNFGRASMCMIGNSIFAVGDSESLAQVLSNFGRVYRAKVDTQGARAID
jgi:pantoate kinase